MESLGQRSDILPQVVWIDDPNNTSNLLHYVPSELFTIDKIISNLNGNNTKRSVI